MFNLEKIQSIKGLSAHGGKKPFFKQGCAFWRF